MSEAIEDLRALDSLRREEREKAWIDRDRWLSAVAKLGVHVRVVNDEARHCRATYPGGWFDFWPSTGRWSQSARANGKRAARGNGLDELVAAIRQAAA